jgi:two-component system, OmpR family, response regulator
MRVKIVQWPSQEREREHYRSLGVPRLLVVEEQAKPPSSLDALEDWVRLPIHPDDMRARVAALQVRALAGVPLVDDSDILRFGGQCVPLSPIDAALMRTMIASYQNVVSRMKLVSEAWPQSKPSRSALDLRILRLRRKITPLSLEIRTVWRQGYLLDLAEGTRNDGT